MVVDFDATYHQNLWGSEESRSGPGSTLEQTEHIRSVFPDLFRRFGIKSILDTPCGDFNWMSHVDLSGIHYTGGDLVPELVEGCKKKYADREGVTFANLNVISDDLPKVDLILCRDLLVHMPFEQCHEAIANFKRSGAKYLLVTTFTNCNHNSPELFYNIWRPLDMTKAPFDFPTPEEIINEGCTENGKGGVQFPDKSLGLWRLDQL